LLGTLFNWALYGIVAVQVYIYHLSFPKDNIKIKCLVYFVLAFETAQTIMNGVDVFNGFARGFGDMAIIGNPGISPVYTPVMGSIIAFVVQMFFCYRILVIRRSAWWLCVLIALVRDCTRSCHLPRADAYNYIDCVDSGGWRCRRRHKGMRCFRARLGDADGRRRKYSSTTFRKDTRMGRRFSCMCVPFLLLAWIP
ncbi:hypothetical protein BDZ89DRAFT_959871, partial [Hymenopellis radicata]